MEQTEIKAYAKINITLDVIQKRDDGFHDVKMIMQTISLCDNILIKKIKNGICVKSNVDYLPFGAGNIAYKAANIFLQNANITDGIDIFITKNIPVAAGLAGGSTDAAAVLRGLNKIYGNIFSIKKLMEMGAELGSDVPYCIAGGSMLAEGKGEILSKLAPMPGVIFLVAKPPIHISTAWVYQNLKADKLREHPDTAGCIKALANEDIRGVSVRMFNVLETVTTPKYPVIREMKLKMIEYGALGSVMSGSGSTVLGMFADLKSAQMAEAEIKQFTNEVFIVNVMDSID